MFADEKTANKLMTVFDRPEVTAADRTFKAPPLPASDRQDVRLLFLSLSVELG